MEWELLRRLMDAAQRRARVEARRLASAILDASRDEAIRAVASAYLEGARSGLSAHAAALALPAGVTERMPRAQARRLRDAAITQGETTVAAALTLGSVTRAQVEAYANLATRESVWNGQDQAGQEAAGLAEAEFKTWVRSWPRRRERDHHDTLEGVTIPIADKFTLPGGPYMGSRVRGPRDWQAVPSPGEHAHCGHALLFSMIATGQDVAKTRRLGRVVYEPPDPRNPSPRSE